MCFMALRDFLILMLVCVVWGLNAVVSKVVLVQGDIPPLLFAAGRFAVIIACVFPWILPVPRPLGRVLLVGLLMGAGVFGLVFVGLQTSTPSSVGVVTQLGVPMITVMSYFMLGEKLDVRRGLGTLLAVAGALTVMWEPGGFALSTGLLFVAASALCGALGAILMKKITGVKALQFQAWVGLSSLPPVLAASLLFERGQVQAVTAHPGYFIGGILFTGLIVSVLAHTTYFSLIRRYDTNLLAPLTVVTPLLTVLFGVTLTGDPFGPKLAFGAALAVAGVLVIAVQPRVWLAALARARSAP